MANFFKFCLEIFEPPKVMPHLCKNRKYKLLFLQLCWCVFLFVQQKASKPCSSPKNVVTHTCHVWSTFFWANGNRMNQTWIYYNFLVGTEKWHCEGGRLLTPVVLRAIFKVKGAYASRVVTGKFITFTMGDCFIVMFVNETRREKKVSISKNYFLDDILQNRSQCCAP